jgi:hypothetical protein
MSGDSKVLQDVELTFGKVVRMLGLNFLNGFQKEGPAIRKAVQTAEAEFQFCGREGVRSAEVVDQPREAIEELLIRSETG